MNFRGAAGAGVIGGVAGAAGAAVPAVVAALSIEGANGRVAVSAAVFFKNVRRVGVIIKKADTGGYGFHHVLPM